MSKTKRKVPEAFKPFMKKKGENHLTPSNGKRNPRKAYMIDRAEMLLNSPVAGMINKTKKEA